MATVQEHLHETIEVAKAEVTQLDEVAETIRNDALAWAESRLGALQRGQELSSLFMQPDFVEGFRYGLAKGIANALAAHDARVQRIYYFDPSGNPDFETAPGKPPEVSIHMIALISKASAALNEFIASLDRALVAALQQFSLPRFSEREWILDLKLVTASELESGKGFASYLRSTFSPPLKLWARE